MGKCKEKRVNPKTKQEESGYAQMTLGECIVLFTGKINVSYEAPDDEKCVSDCDCIGAKIWKKRVVKETWESRDAKAPIMGMEG